MAGIVNGAGFWEIPPDEVLDSQEIAILLEHTANTWQKGRKKEEMLRDIVQGKKAEYAFERFLETYTRVRYFPYDRFRKDDFKKHAPFDGLLYREEVPSERIDYFAEQICKEIAFEHSMGRISPALLMQMEEQGIFTMEVKSSVLKHQLGDYRNVSSKKPRVFEDHAQMIRNIERWDFFVYPHYVRSSNEIESFYDYTEYVKKQYPENFEGLSNENFLQKLMQEEFAHASDIYTRLYFDYEAGLIYIPGYLLKETFYQEPKIQRMSGIKSGQALYYMHSIQDRKAFPSIQDDTRIWNFNREASLKRLLAGKRRYCSCGGAIRYCNSKKNRTYFCKCYDCNREYPFWHRG